MAKILSVANQLLSLKGCIRITDENDALAYEARGEWAFLSPTWRVFTGENVDDVPNATIRKRIFSWVPTWDIDAGTGLFQIRRKVFSWTRQYYAVGGEYDGAIIKGNIWDLKFAITHHSRTLATAAQKIFTFRDRHSVEIPGEGEWFVVMAMLVMQIDRRMEQSKRMMNNHDD